MGSTGSSAVSANATPNVQTVSSLSDTADAATISKYYKDNFGIDIGGSYWKDGLDTKVLARTAEVLDRLVQELGKDVFDELGLRIVSWNGIKGAAYAQTSLTSGKITVNPNKFNSYDTLKAGVHSDVASGFHPKGMKAGDIIVHEVGHNLEFLINKRVNKGNNLQQYVDDSQQTFSKAIVQQAYSEIKKSNPHLYQTEKQARASISRYADSKWHGTVAYTECMAEAVADYGRNGNNATPMSKHIWQGIKNMLA